VLAPLNPLDPLSRCINPLVLEKCSFDFCFLGGGPTHDDFFKAFSTHLAYPNLKDLHITFFDNGLKRKTNQIIATPLQANLTGATTL